MKALSNVKESDKPSEAAGPSAKKLLQILLREPLLHFSLLGTVLFGLYYQLNPESLVDENRIVVNEGRINQLRAQFVRSWQREPNPSELQMLIDDFVMEEIYYRQALALGIDQDDPMIRRRLRQKMEFYTSASNSYRRPSQEELQAYLEAHRERYSQPATYSFSQIYIATDVPREVTDTQVNRVKTALANNLPVAGDHTSLSREFNEVSAFEVDRHFGQGFALRLDTLTQGRWQGPISSGMGLHFIRINKRDSSVLLPLSLVKEQVQRDWIYDRAKSLQLSIEQALRQQYQVEIERPQRDTPI